MFEYTGAGPNFGLGTSAQSVHPNGVGTELYTTAANTEITSTNVPLASSLVGGATTTYYSTFRLHDGGPASLNVTSFSSWGQEIRFGLRKNDASSGGTAQPWQAELYW